ncbi:DNA polymerase IV [Candidatus Parcubacteria bacterium]|jgi:DNA polymerase-4|nr:MAG: DNA polymerase IV [Candidatus Parcubacteria bacterium]
MQKIILHFDMNSYFASVEQQANPFLRGQPVGVCATLTKQGCIIASSKEAKAFGVKTGCRAEEARILCPAIKLVEVDPPKYHSTTQRIMSICREYTSDIELYSIDEAFLNLTGLVKSFSAAFKLGREIKARIRRELGECLSSSTGIAYTRWLAKFGSDTAPKGGIVTITPANRLAHLQGRELEQAWGIGAALAPRLQALGIQTLDQLAQYSPINLLEIFGIRGYELWANVNGLELGGLQTRELPKSIGHSHVLRCRTRDVNFHKSLILRLAERAGRRLRALGLEAHSVYAHANFELLGGLGGSQKLFEPLTTTQKFFRYAWNMLAPGVTKDTPKFFAVGLFDLRPLSGQLSLFSKPKPERLLKALDEINNRYGEEVIAQGELVGLDKHHAPDRIGFRKTVGVDI